MDEVEIMLSLRCAYQLLGEWKDNHLDSYILDFAPRPNPSKAAF